MTCYLLLPCKTRFCHFISSAFHGFCFFITLALLWFLFFACFQFVSVVNGLTLSKFRNSNSIAQDSGPTYLTLHQVLPTWSTFQKIGDFVLYTAVPLSIWTVPGMQWLLNKLNICWRIKDQPASQLAAFGSDAPLGKFSVPGECPLKGLLICPFRSKNSLGCHFHYSLSSELQFTLLQNGISEACPVGLRVVQVSSEIMNMRVLYIL